MAQKGARGDCDGGIMFAEFKASLEAEVKDRLAKLNKYAMFFVFKSMGQANNNLHTPMAHGKHAGHRCFSLARHWCQTN